MLALPRQPLPVEYNAAIKIISQLGAANDGDNFHPVALLGQPADTDLSTYHLIVIGRPSRSPLLQMVNEMLPQPFLPQTDVIRQQIDKIVFRLPPDIDLGYLQLLPSNWSADHALLAVTGVSDLGVTWAARTLADSKQRQLLNGNLAMLRDKEISTIDTRKLASGGVVMAIATAIPEAIVVGTATPTPRSLTPVPSTQAPNTSTTGIASSNEQEPPDWLLFVIGGGIVLIFIILGIAFWQSRRRRRLGL